MSDQTVAVAFPQNLSLDQLESELAAWLDTADMAETPEERAEIEAHIASLITAERAKVDAIVRFSRWLEEQAGFCRAEGKRCTAAATAWESRQERLHAIVQRVMNGWGKSKLGGNVSSLSLSTAQPGLVIDDESAVPVDYKYITVKMRLGNWLDILDSDPKHLRVPAEYEGRVSIDAAALKRDLRDQAKGIDAYLCGLADKGLPESEDPAEFIADKTRAWLAAHGIPGAHLAEPGKTLVRR